MDTDRIGHLVVFNIFVFVVMILSVNDMFAEPSDTVKVVPPKSFGFAWNCGFGLSYLKVSESSRDFGEGNVYLYLRPGLRFYRVVGYLENFVTFMPLYCPSYEDSTCISYVSYGAGIRFPLSRRQSIQFSSGKLSRYGPFFDRALECNIYRSISCSYYRIAWRISRRSWDNDLERKTSHNIEVSWVNVKCCVWRHS